MLAKGMLKVVVGSCFVLAMSNVYALTADDVVCDKCVDRSDINFGAVNSQKIKNYSIQNIDIKNNAITSSKVLNESLTGADIKNESLTGADIDNGSIQGIDIGTKTVGVANISNAALGGVRYTSGPIWTLMDSSNTNYQSLSARAPGDGYFIVRATGTITYSHSSGTSAFLCLDLDTTSGAAPGCIPNSGSKSAFRSFLPTNQANTSGYGESYAIEEVFPVNAKTSYFFYLNGRATGVNTAYLFHPSLVIQYVPSLLPPGLIIIPK